MARDESGSLFCSCLLYDISDCFDNLLHCRGPAHELAPAGGAGGELGPGVTRLADQVARPALPDPPRHHLQAHRT